MKPSEVFKEFGEMPSALIVAKEASKVKFKTAQKDREAVFLRFILCEPFCAMLRA